MEEKVTLGINWLDQTLGLDWLESIETEDINQGSSNLHIIALSFGIDYNIWSEPLRSNDEGRNWLFEHGFSIGKEIEDDHGEAEELTNEWARQVLILQIERYGEERALQEIRGITESTNTSTEEEKPEQLSLF